MAECYTSELLAAMDRLWFHYIVLSSEPIHVERTELSSMSTTLKSASSSSFDSSHGEGETASMNSSTTSISKVDFNTEVKVEVKEPETRVGRKRPSRLNLISKKIRSQSSSPSIQRTRKSLSHSSYKGQKLQRFLSCSTLHDLEQEELKGFMDLGFEFEEDQLSPRTMTVVPGLQRIGGNAVTTKNENYGASTLDDKEVESDEKTKPYLSEAWLVKRPDSPLLRLRMARVSTAEDMKKCLKLWARTVASSMQFDE